MGFRTPKEVLEVVNTLVAKKRKTSAKKTFVAAILAGSYIAIGGLLALVVGGGLPEMANQNPGLQKFIFGAVFPLGLVLVALAGADLFTGNTAYFVPPVLAKRIKLDVPLKNWTIVYLGNFVGAVAVALFFAYYTDLLAEEPWLTATKNMAESKATQPFFKAFLKGIACNWLVALAMWLSFAAKDVTGKILGIWFPIMAFVAMGFEHSIANMFFIPTAIFYGADISWTSFFIDNLLPVTIGNIIGGSIFVGMVYWYLYEHE